MRAYALVVAVVAALGAASLTIACGKDAATTTATPTPAPTSPTTSTFASRLTVNGAVSRTFTATQAGTVTVLLTNAGGPFTRVGLGLGVPTTGVARCALSTAMVTTPGATPQISAAVDPGAYCVTIYDIGTLADTIDFSLTLVYP
jgi:hypothetical protein